VDTNSLIVTERLYTIGFDVRLKAVVGDDIDEAARVFEGALTWADVVILTGGLGPTEDDITREVVARVLQVPLELHEQIVERIRDRLAPLSRGAGLFRRVIKITGRAESDVDTAAQPIYGKWGGAPVPISTTILAVLGQIELHLTARAPTRAAADTALDAAVAEL